MLTYGPIIANTIANFRRAEGHLCYTNKWHRNTTVHNMHLMSGNKPFVFKEWSESGIFTLDLLFNEKGLLSFEELQASFDVPKTSFYFYLCLRLALKCYGAPWGERS